MLQSINPYTGELIKNYPELGSEEVQSAINQAQEAYQNWKLLSYEERAVYFQKLAKLMHEQRHNLAVLMAEEMGKPYSSGLAEIDKCVWATEYYASNTATMLHYEKIELGVYDSRIVFEPLGIILAVMPWNFPFWQVIRFAVPTLMAGNVGLLKHASNVSGASLRIAELFQTAGFPTGVFQSLLIGSDQVASILSHDLVRGVALTGSDKAGRAVAQLAGEQIKPSVLELGSNDPFIVLEDAQIPNACQSAVTARLQNNGQSCIAGKRFIIVASRYEEFLENFSNIWSSAVIGNPLDPATTIGPLVNQKAVDIIQQQVADSVARGAVIHIGGEPVTGLGCFYQPTILTNVTKGMPAYDEEIFGPVASVIKVSDEAEAIAVANDSKFALGASVWTENVETANRVARQLETGAVFVNSLVKSDPRMPFGGIKQSGYGRELGSYGLKSFVNIKSIWIDNFQG